LRPRDAKAALDALDALARAEHLTEVYHTQE
jgi:hypothetical protein